LFSEAEGKEESEDAQEMEEGEEQVDVGNAPNFEERSEVPKELRQFPAIWSEEGKYLASVLGDALVKGLTQVSQERPDDPVEYLANYLKKYGGEKSSAIEAAVAAAAAENSSRPTSRTKTPPISAIHAAPAMVLSTKSRTGSKTSMKSTKNSAKSMKSNHAMSAENEAQDETEMDSPLTLPDVITGKLPSSKSRSGSRTSHKSGKKSAKSSKTPADSGETEAGAGDKTEQEVMKELEQDEDEMMQRLEDAADDEANREALEGDDDDENGIGTVDDGDDGGDVDPSQNGTRDDRGQSVLHFAAARPGGASTILAFLQNPSVNLAWKDERLRTARDIAKGMTRAENLKTIDSWIVSLAIAGKQ
jgi:hypothetical protein